jgi:glycerate-2-kinase
MADVRSAKLLYPATVISLIFSDVAGDNYNFVDSGPTYLDTSTIADAKAIIDRYDLGKFELTETPKDPKFFEKVHNIPVKLFS